MNRDEYKTLTTSSPAKNAVITADQLLNRMPRTLIYGYTLERHTFHVYLGLDEAIHVLVYKDVSDDPETGAARYLILDHAGPGGRQLESNREFLPSKRAYPESCDFEFCKVLRGVELYPSFTTFTDDADEPRNEKFYPFAGKTAHPLHSLKGKSLNTALQSHPMYQERVESDTTLAQRLLFQAANDLGVPADTYGGEAIVAAYGADAVLQKAIEYLESITVFDVQSSTFASDLVNEAFGYGHYIHAGRADLVNGRISITVHPEQVPFTEDAKFKRYQGTTFKGAQALIGEVEGMPFIAAHLGENMVVLEVLQFGDRERCLAMWMRMFNLTPMRKKKAVKPAQPA
jgi:hypothetical protein